MNRQNQTSLSPISSDPELDIVGEHLGFVNDAERQSFLNESPATTLPVNSSSNTNPSSSQINASISFMGRTRHLPSSSNKSSKSSQLNQSLHVHNHTHSILNFPTMDPIQNSPFSSTKFNISKIIDPNKPLNLEDKLRVWRHDAMQQNLLKTAEYWADKLVQLTNHQEDVYWLAHVRYLQGDYFVSLQMLTKKDLLGRSLASRYLAAQCLVKLEKYWEALELLGRENPFKDSKVNVKITDNEEGLKLESSMCWLRGEIYNKLNHRDSAKKCWLEALQVDYKCYEAYFSLLTNGLLSKEDEAKILSEDFYNSNTAQCPSSSIITRRKSKLMNKESPIPPSQSKDFQLVKNLYSIQLSKLDQVEDHFDTLKKDFNLECQLEKTVKKVDQMFLSGNYEDCLDATEDALKHHPNHAGLMATHINCLAQQENGEKLYALGVTLQNSQPNFYLTHFALGSYHFVLKQYATARRYFETCIEIHPTYEPALLGVGHTHILEGEYDAAICSYARTAKLLPYSHLPPMFLGLRYSSLGNYKLAFSYFKYSLRLMKTPDPYFLNEFAAFCIKTNSAKLALEFLPLALNHAPVSETGYKMSEVRESLLYNLGHAFRTMQRWSEAEKTYEQLKQEHPTSYKGYLGLALVAYYKGQYGKSIELLHNCSALSPSNQPEVQLVMDRVMAKWSEIPFNFDFGVWNNLKPCSSIRAGSPLDSAPVKKNKLQ